jgi:uncharacterized protein
MNYTFFDCNARIGLPVVRTYNPAPDSADLMAKLAPAGINKALIWHSLQLDYSPQEGNRILADDLAGRGDVYGCWAIVSPQTREIIDHDFFDRMRSNRVVALRAFPDKHNFIMDRVVFGKFLDEVSERRIPVMVSAETGMNWNSIQALLRDFPKLTCVICDLGSWGVDRRTWPLLEYFPNVYIETSYLSLAACGLQTTVAKYGAQRLLFGTGFPYRSPHASVLDLVHSEISEQDKHLIARGNLERLISEARI